MIYKTLGHYLKSSTCTAVLMLALHLQIPVQAQVSIGFERDRTKNILKKVSKTIRDRFYDPKFRGLDWEKLTDQASQDIENASSAREMVSIIFALVHELQDSHTFFIPPSFATKISWGFEAQAFGEKIFVHEIEEDSAAADSGLAVGDRLWKIGGFKAERGTLDLLLLHFRYLQPVVSMDLTFTRGGGAARLARVQSKIKRQSLVTDLTRVHNIYNLIREAESDKVTFYYDFDEKSGIGFLRIPSFDVDKGLFSKLVKKIKKSRATIVDLRGNPGGAIKSLEHFTGFFESQPTVIAQLVGRKKTEPLKAKPRKPSLAGPMFILTDSRTASAAEVFARHFQLQAQAIVIGDRSAGRVTVSRVFPYQEGIDRVVPYAVQVAISKLVFPDGEQLEKKGVIPNQQCIPNAEDLRGETDKCLSLAYEMAHRALGESDESTKE